jgi:hypothetical protein
MTNYEIQLTAEIPEGFDLRPGQNKNTCLKVP